MASLMEYIKKILNERSDLCHHLYTRGYLITSDNINNLADKHPFYSNWKKSQIGSYQVWVHKLQRIFLHKQGNYSYFLIGHAYNPFTMEYNEENLLKYLVSSDFELFISKLSELTGMFIIGICDSKNIKLFCDCSCVQLSVYGIHNNNLFISSHSSLIADICQLQMDDYVKELVSYKFYPLFGRYLPGDISPYLNFKRLIPNTYLNYKNNTIDIIRFFPDSNFESFKNQNYDEIIFNSASIINNSMKLIHKKWDRPAISLTGGCDSKTTLSCTNGEYDHYQYFSYDSVDKEAVDAHAANKICQKLGLKHKTYYIPREKFNDYQIFKEILKINCGNIGKNNTNDIQKRIFFIYNDDFDIEVKSWISEIVRAYYHKRFSKKAFPRKPFPRYLTSLYKVFLHNRKLIKKTDLIFAEFLDKYYTESIFKYINWIDLFFWEFRVGSWNGPVITGEQQISYDITIPYNNRKLLSQLISLPIDKRIKDIPHKDIMRMMNPEIADIGISVVNVDHTYTRSLIEKVYLYFNSYLPL